MNQIFLLEYTVAQPSRTELLRPLRVLVLDSPENLSESSHEVIIKCMKSTKIPTLPKVSAWIERTARSLRTLRAIFQPPTHMFVMLDVL